jgi:hypothetical protein
MLVFDNAVVAADQSDLKRKRILMLDLNKIADVKNNNGDSDGALMAIKASLAFARNLAKANDNVSTRRDVSATSSSRATHRQRSRPMRRCCRSTGVRQRRRPTIPSASGRRCSA